MDRSNLGKSITHLRKVSVIAVIASGLGSILMFVIGAVKVFRAYHSYFLNEMLLGTGPLSGANLSIAYLVQAIDAFLIALVLMIFGGGIYNLFIQNEPDENQQSPSVMRIRSIAELKSILAELVIIILMVKFLEGALKTQGELNWPMLILPAAVLMLAAAVRILKLKE